MSNLTSQSSLDIKNKIWNINKMPINALIDNNISIIAKGLGSLMVKENL